MDSTLIAHYDYIRREAIKEIDNLIITLNHISIEANKYVSTNEREDFDNVTETCQNFVETLSEMSDYAKGEMYVKMGLFHTMDAYLKTDNQGDKIESK